MAVFDHKVQCPPAGYLTGSEVFLSAQIIWFKYCRGADVIGLIDGTRPFPEDGTDERQQNWMRDDDSAMFYLHSCPSRSRSPCLMI